MCCLLYSFFFNDPATTERYSYDTLFPYTTLFRSRIDQPLIALERRRFLVAIPVRAESDLRHPALVGPAGRSALGAGGRRPMQQHHVGMTGMNLVERRPDMAVVVAGGAAAEGDAG